MYAFIRSLTTLAAATVVSVFAFASPSEANVRVHIDISSQVMTVAVNGSQYASWRVSTGRKGYYTPRGAFRPFMLKKMHYSRKYDNSPMPNSVFFRGGYAIHGTGYLKYLGRPASHGCIRLAPGNAAKLYGLIQRHGMRNTRIVISN